MPKKTSRFQKRLEQVWSLLDERLHPEFKDAWWNKFAHFWLLVWRSFTRNRCPVRASALAYATLLALIPMLAVVVGVTSTFLKKEGEARVDQFIVKLVTSVTSSSVLTTNVVGEGPLPLEGETSAAAYTNSAMSVSTNRDASATNLAVLPTFARDPQAVKMRKDMARRINEFIQNTRSGALGVTGSVLLIFAAISMLSRIEDTFNDIWGVARGRSWFTRIVVYWGVITLAPMLVIVAIGLATGPHLGATRHLIASLPVVGGTLVQVGLQVLPVLVLCVSFAGFYKMIPNTKVEWGAAIIGGLAGGLLFHANNLLNVLYVSRVVSNSLVYGSVALLPVFMIGLYLAWLILLFGAQVAYAYQNRATYFEERQLEFINQRGREFVALRLLTLVAQRFARGDPPASVSEMAEALSVPSRLILQILQTLSAARLVVEAAGPEAAYVPARPIETITCHDLLLAMRAAQGHDFATRDEPTRSEVLGEYSRIQEAERQAASSVSLLALVQRAERAQLPLSSESPRGG